MADIISELAGKCGISSELAQKGLGAVLAYLKTNLPPETYAQVSAAVPAADNLAAEAQATPQQTGGMMSALVGAVGKLFGGGGNEGQLLSRLTSAGFSADQLEKFLPGVLEMFKGKLPDDVMKQLGEHVPVPEAASH
jgi:hypothetical protein